MNQRISVALMVVLACLVALPSVAHAQRRSPARRAKPVAKQTKAKQRAFVKSALKKAREAKLVLKHSQPDKVAARKLHKKLSKKQRAALRRFSRMMLQDARGAVKKRKQKFALSAKRLRPHVVAIGSKDANALATASMMGAADQAEQEVTNLAKRLQRNLDATKRVGENVAELRDVIAEGKFPLSFTYGAPKEQTVVLKRKGEGEALLQRLQRQLQTMSDLSEQLQLQLQDMMNKQQQAMKILSNIMKNQHDTLNAIIDNMR